MPDDQGQEFCIDCGAKIPDEASFCPECGEEIDTQDDDKNSETKLSQVGDAVKEGYDAVKDNYDTVTDDQSIRQEERDDIEGRKRELYNKAKRLVNDAEGDIDPEMLIATREEERYFWRKEINLRLYNPLISYLDEGEQPHHLLCATKGAVLSVFRPEKDETTILPDRDEHSYDEQSDYSFLMATDKRLLYIAADDGQDYLWEFDYSDIYMIQNDNIGLSDTLKFYTTDQCEYSYPLTNSSIGSSDQSNAIGYIKEKVELDEKRLLGHFWLRTKGKMRSAIQEVRSQR